MRCTGMPFVLLYLAVEIVAVVALASWIGVGWTLLILFVGAVLGLWLARREGLRALRALAEAARDRRVAHVELTDGLLVAAGGLLLVIPGLVTDVLALLLLLPPTRSLVRRRMVRAAEAREPLLRTARIRADGTVVDGWSSSADPRRPVRGEIVQNGGVVDGEIVEGEIVDGPDTLGGARPKA